MRGAVPGPPARRPAHARNAVQQYASEVVPQEAQLRRGDVENHRLERFERVGPVRDPLGIHAHLFERLQHHRRPVTARAGWSPDPVDVAVVDAGRAAGRSAAGGAPAFVVDNPGVQAAAVEMGHAQEQPANLQAFQVAQR